MVYEEKEMRWCIPAIDGRIRELEDECFILDDVILGNGKRIESRKRAGGLTVLELWSVMDTYFDRDRRAKELEKDVSKYRTVMYEIGTGLGHDE